MKEAKLHTLPAGEWVGHCALAPSHIAVGEDAQRMAVAIWLELPADKVVGVDVFLARELRPEKLGELLRKSLAAPQYGKPRSPAAIRVADEASAEAVRAIVGEDLTIRVGPVREVEAALTSLFAHLGSSGADGPNEGEPSERLVLLARLAAARGKTVHWAVGVLNAAATHPSMKVMPSQWLPLLLGDGPRESQFAEMQATMGTIMSLYNGFVAYLNDGELFMPPRAETEKLEQWRDGYLECLMLDDAWTRDEEAMRILAPLRAWDPRHSPVSKNDDHPLADAVLEAHDHFRAMRMAQAGARRAADTAVRAPRPGRNEACPCGSGKKFKRCCGES